MVAIILAVCPSTKISVEQVSTTLAKKKHFCPWCQKIAILILMQFLNNIIISGYGFKAAQKF